MRQQYLYWHEGWLSIENNLIADRTLLWPTPAIDHEGPLNRQALAQMGGHFLERRPDRMDCPHIAHGLLSRILRDEPDAWVANIPMPRAMDTVEVTFIENHQAVFFRGYRIPITKTAIRIPDSTVLCQLRRGDPRWLTMWRCQQCGGYVLMMQGRDRQVEYFTETIRRDFSHIYETIDLPDEFLAQTCIDCGAIEITTADAAIVKEWENTHGQSG